MNGRSRSLLPTSDESRGSDINGAHFLSVVEVVGLCTHFVVVHHDIAGCEVQQTVVDWRIHTSVSLAVYSLW